MEDGIPGGSCIDSGISRGVLNLKIRKLQGCGKQAKLYLFPSKTDVEYVEVCITIKSREKLVGDISGRAGIFETVFLGNTFNFSF